MVIGLQWNSPRVCYLLGVSVRTCRRCAREEQCCWKKQMMCICVVELNEVFLFCFFLLEFFWEKKSFILNENTGKMEILEEKNQHGHSFSCLFKWKDGLSLKWLCKSLNVFEMPVSFRSMLRLLYKAFPSLFGSVDFTKQLFLIMCQLRNSMRSPSFLAWPTAQWIWLLFWYCDLALAWSFWRWLSQGICNV